MKTMFSIKSPYNVCLTLPVKLQKLQYEKAEPPFLAPAGIRFNRTLTGCMKDNITKTYQIMTPVYADKAEVFANIKSGPPGQ
jgi:hypothetical protein